jgi:8-oxo-dGTP diphosphatase
MRYKNPCATVDLIVEKNNKILLIKRKNGPFKNMWALPGGFLDYGKETLEQAAKRELEEETSIITKTSDLELLGIYSDPGRDPRGHVISHTYIVKEYAGTPKANDDAKDVGFFSLENLPELAFDHDRIIEDYKNV